MPGVFEASQKILHALSVGMFDKNQVAADAPAGDLPLSRHEAGRRKFRG